MTNRPATSPTTPPMMMPVCRWCGGGDEVAVVVGGGDEVAVAVGGGNEVAVAVGGGGLEVGFRSKTNTPFSLTGTTRVPVPASTATEYRDVVRDDFLDNCAIVGNDEQIRGRRVAARLVLIRGGVKAGRHGRICDLVDPRDAADISLNISHGDVDNVRRLETED